MLAVGIEPTSTALQTDAMTTSAKPALGCPTSIDLVLPVSQTSVQATTLRTPLFNGQIKTYTTRWLYILFQLVQVHLDDNESILPAKLMSILF